jgi:signal transduction histidine kinase
VETCSESGHVRDHVPNRPRNPRPELAGERLTMRDVGRSRRAAAPSNVLLSLDEEYARILALLDRPTAIRRIMAGVPELAGVDVAWVGEPDGKDRMVLRHTVNTETGAIEGLVVSVGTGLGGKVLAARRPMWVSDYCADPAITDHFKTQVEAEHIRAMIAVPITHGDQLLGVLYGANRGDIAIGSRTAEALEWVAARAAAAEVVAERARHAAEVAVHEERRRLALELHDTVGATLFTLHAGIQQLGDEPHLDAELRARLTALERHAVDAAAALRGSLRVLNAPPEQVALGVALREHCRAFTERTSVTARVITLTELPTMTPARVRILTDAAREALLNVEKHAHARSVVVSVFTLRNGVAVTVSDDGVGLRDDHEHSDGLGLVTMAERLAQVGGTVAIGRNDDGGVTVQAWTPA